MHVCVMKLQDKVARRRDDEDDGFDLGENYPVAVVDRKERSQSQQDQNGGDQKKQSKKQNGDDLFYHGQEEWCGVCLPRLRRRSWWCWGCRHQRSL